MSDDLFQAVRAAVNRYDAEGLLAAGFPEEEYDPEVRSLCELVVSDEPLDANTVNDVWAAWFGGRGSLSKMGLAEQLSSDLQAIRDAL